MVSTSPPTVTYNVKLVLIWTFSTTLAPVVSFTVLYASRSVSSVLWIKNEFGIGMLTVLMSGNFHNFVKFCIGFETKIFSRNQTIKKRAVHWKKRILVCPYLIYYTTGYSSFKCSYHTFWKCALFHICIATLKHTSIHKLIFDNVHNF